MISLAIKALLATLVLFAATPAVAQKKKLSLAELAALEWKLEQAGNTLTGNPDVATRTKAVADLASLKDSRTAKPLATALREDPDAGVRQRAAEALAALKTPEGKGLLTLASTADPDAAVRSSAATLLKGFPKKMAVATLPMTSRPFQEPKAAPTLAALQKTLSLPSGDARLWAMQKLGALKAAGTTKLLETHLLRDPSARVRTEAAKSLAAQLKIKSLPTLIKAAEDGDPSVRFEISHLISDFDDVGALMVLQKLASSDANETVKAEALDLLEPSTPVGRRLLKARIGKLRSANPAERIAALSELSSSTHWRAILPMSCSLLNDKSVNVRSAAAKVLTNMHDSTVLIAMRVAAELEREKKLQGAVRALLTGMRKRVDALVKQLQSGEVAARALAARALGQASYPQGLEPLIASLKDKDAKVRLAVVRALVSYTEPKAKEALKLAGTDADKRVRTVVDRFFKEQQQLEGWRTFYKDPNRVVTKTTDKDPIWRFDAAIALGVAGAESAVASLAQLLLHDKEESVRHAAAWALVLMGSDRGEAALKTAAAKDPSEKLRLTARKYLVIDKASVDDLVRQLSDDAAASRQDAAEALSLRASGKVQNHLIRAALCDTEARVRSASLRGLARIGNKMTRSVILVSLSRDAEARVRRTAMVMHILAGGK